MTFQCTLQAHDDHIKLKNIKLTDNVDLSALPVPDVKGIILDAALEELEKAGFTNINTVSDGKSIWDKDHWIITKQSLEPGSTAQKNEEFLLTCIKTKEYLEEKLNGLSVPNAIDVTRELDFAPSFVNSITGKDMDDRIDTMSSQEKAEWIVKEIDPASSGKRKAKFVLVCTGDREIPDVVGLSLADAKKTLKELDFSSIKAESISGGSIWNDSNWKVMTQSVDPGKTTAADSDIVLMVKSYKELEKEEEGASEEGAVIQETEDTVSDTSLTSVSVAAEPVDDNTSNPEGQSNIHSGDETGVESDELKDSKSAEVDASLEESVSEAEETAALAVSEAHSEVDEAEEPEDTTPLDYEDDLQELLLADQDVEALADAFSKKYAGIGIEFTGAVAYAGVLENDADAVLIHAGEYTEQTVHGPDILFENYQPDGTEEGPQLSIGDVVAVSAAVQKYDQERQMLIVDPQSVRIISQSDLSEVDYRSKEIVKLVQVRLNEEEFDCGAVDGMIGPNTLSKIQEYRQARGISQNDRIDAELLAFMHITPLMIKQAIPTLPPTPEPTVEPERVLIVSSDTAGPSESGTRGYSSSNFNTYDNPEQQNTSQQWVLNTNTKKIHRPSCNSVTKIAKHNYSTSSSSLEELKQRGYSPCENCLKGY